MSDPSGTGDEASAGSESPSAATALEGPDGAGSFKRKPETQNDKSKKKSKLADKKRSSSEENADLSSGGGQFAGNPQISRDEAKFQAKREYHRQNAARARLRSKENVESLQHQVASLSKRSEILERENEVLKAQLQILLSHQQQPQQAQPPHQQQHMSHGQMPSSHALQQDLANSLLALLQNNQAGSTMTPRAPAPFLNNDPNMAAAQFAQAFANQMQQQQLQQQQYQQAANAMSQWLTMPQGQGPKHNLSSQISQGNIESSNDTGHASHNQQQQQDSSEQQNSNIKQEQLSQTVNQLRQKQPLLPEQEQRSQQLGLLQDIVSQTQDQPPPGSALMAQPPPGSALMAQPTPGSSLTAQQPLPPPAANIAQQVQDNVLYEEGQHQQIPQQQMQLLLQQMQNPVFAQILGQVSPQMLGSILAQLGQVPDGNNQDLNDSPS